MVPPSWSRITYPARSESNIRFGQPSGPRSWSAGPRRSIRKVAHFSLVIIGSGSGNVLVPKGQALGPVALIESGAFGGTCVNRGCIPSKILIQTAEVAAQVRHAPEFGIEAKLTGVDWPAIRDRT